MTPQETPNVLASLFGDAVQTLAPGSYQIEQEGFRLLVLRSEDQDWIRMMVPIASLMEAGAFLEELLEANFDETQEARYAVHQGLVWSVFQHDGTGLTEADFKGAIGRLVSMFRQGLDLVFKRHVEKQIRQIIRAAKMQGQTLEMTMQTLERFYSEGVMGDLDQSSEGAIEAWRVQLKRLWDEEK
jgi:Tir chaperone protein (CesT) family